MRGNTAVYLRRRWCRRGVGKEYWARGRGEKGVGMGLMLVWREDGWVVWWIWGGGGLLKIRARRRRALIEVLRWERERKERVRLL
jgi:hypothetical protein